VAACHSALLVEHLSIPTTSIGKMCIRIARPGGPQHSESPPARFHAPTITRRLSLTIDITQTAQLLMLLLHMDIQ
jgi:hypothetical protein